MDARLPVIFGGQIIIYLTIKLFQHNYHVLKWPIDSQIPFIAEWIYVYLSFFMFMIVCSSYLFIKDRNNYYQLFRMTIIGTMITYIVFLCYPTQMVEERNLCDTDALTRLLCMVTFAADYPAINCCPSLHCVDTFIVLYAIVCSSKTKLWVKGVVLIMSILIVSSILFTKQHYVVDIVGALVVVFLSIVCINKIFWGLVFPVSQTRNLASDILL